MAQRPTWKGVLKIGLVTIPIRVFPATTEGDSLSFNQLHQPCGTRIHQRRWCVVCGREVPSAELVKGYEFEKGRFVIVTEADLAKVRPPSAHVIDLVQFADADALDPVSLDRAYYLAPDGGPAGEAYAVMREGMQGKVGIGKLALYGREYLVAVRPQLWTLVLYTLHHAAEIRQVEEIEDLHAVTKTVPRAQVRLARQVIAHFSVPAGEAPDLSRFTDAYRAQLQRLIDAKIAGEEIVEPKVDPSQPVRDLHEALTQSLLAVSGAKKKSAKASPHEPRLKRRRGAIYGTRV